MKQTVLVTGAGGQLGRELIARSKPGLECVAVTRSQLDISDVAAVADIFRDIQPQLVINAAAYTAVDRAESEPESAMRANAQGPENLALACRESGVHLLHISTDFVFNGESNRPYTPASAPAPVSEYGRGKLAGERAVQKLLPGALILRTGWVYSGFGGNFVLTSEMGAVPVGDGSAPHCFLKR